jgi:hypothetical protein
LHRLQRTLAVVFAVAWAAACDPDALLGPDAPQGIEGIALRGPVCPVVSDDSKCADQPHQAWIVIEDASGRRIVRLQTGEDGRFRVGLAAAAYRIVPESGDPFPVGSDQIVEVEPGEFTQIIVSFDTGIR